jgi:MoaA/NifB/PqqE/SkfB family radical SAM enzyme
MKSRLSLALTEELVRIENNGVYHTTLFLMHEGRIYSVRIHLRPARRQAATREPSIVFINGDIIIPLGFTWTVLLARFIDRINEHAGQDVSAELFHQVLEEVAEECHEQVFTKTKKERMVEDLGRIIDTIVDISLGRTPDAQIGQISIRDYAPNMRGPDRMDLLVSSISKDGVWHCNQKCAGCYAAGQCEAEVPELSTAEWKKLIDKCRRIGIPQLTFTGGEPTMRDDLFDLIEYSRWFVTRLNTNGLKLTPRYCARLCEVSLDVLQVTLYSHIAEVHNRITQGDWEQTVQGIKNAIAAGLIVSVNTPLVSIDQDYPGTLKFLSSIGVCFASCSGLIKAGKAKGATDLGREDLMRILKEAAAFDYDDRIELSFTSPGVLSEEDLLSTGITSVPMCGACLGNMAIAPNGDVIPCQSWLSAGAKLGNLLVDDWRDIWDHDLARSIRAMGDEEALVCPFRSGQFQEETR